MTTKEYPTKDVRANFDIDLKIGEKHEDEIKDIFGSNGKYGLEVKTELDNAKKPWFVSGNIALEIKSRDKLSGISTTNADWWIHKFATPNGTKFFIGITVDDLKKMTRKLLNKKEARIVKNSGDDGAQTLILVPVEKLFNQIMQSTKDEYKK